MRRLGGSGGAAEDEAGAGEQVLDPEPLGVAVGAGDEVEQVGVDVEGLAALGERVVVRAAEGLGLHPRAAGVAAVELAAQPTDAAGDLLDRAAGGLLDLVAEPSAEPRRARRRRTR